MHATPDERTAIEFAKVIRCSRCVEQGESGILRDDSFNLPQPGYVGWNYWDTRLLLIGQNPGTSPPRFREQDQRYAQALAVVGEHGSADALADLQAVLEEIIPTWPVRGDYFPLEECGLSLADIAYFNLVRCRTRGNKPPSSKMIGNCVFEHLTTWIEFLQPKVVVCIGKWAYDHVEASLSRADIPCTFVNRMRSLNRTERRRNRAGVAALVRRALDGTSALDRGPGILGDATGATDDSPAGSVPAPVTSKAKPPSAEIRPVQGKPMSSVFMPIFRELGIEFCKKLSATTIDNNKVLRCEGRSLGIYFNEATQDREAYFAASEKKYSGFGWPHWREVQSPRAAYETRQGYLTVLPVSGKEQEAFQALLDYASR